MRSRLLPLRVRGCLKVSAVCMLCIVTYANCSCVLLKIEHDKEQSGKARNSDTEGTTSGKNGNKTQ